METITIRVTPYQKERIEALREYPRETVGDIVEKLLNRYALTEAEHRERVARFNAREAQEQR